MSKKQKEIIEKMKLLITALESTMDQEPMAKSASEDDKKPKWRGGTPNTLPPQN